MSLPAFAVQAGIMITVSYQDKLFDTTDQLRVR